MAKSLVDLIDLIVLYGEAKASAAWAESKAEEREFENPGPDEFIRDQKSAERKAAGLLDRIKKFIGAFE